MGDLLHRGGMIFVSICFAPNKATQVQMRQVRMSGNKERNPIKKKDNYIMGKENVILGPKYMLTHAEKRGGAT